MRAIHSIATGRVTLIPLTAAERAEIEARPPPVAGVDRLAKLEAALIDKGVITRGDIESARAVR